MYAYLIDVAKGEHRPLNTATDLETLYRLIGCRCITIVVRRVQGHPVNIVCDDEGLLKERYTFGAVNGRMRPELAGNLLICGMRDDGELRSLNDAELGAIEGRMGKIFDKYEMLFKPCIVLD